MNVTMIIISTWVHEYGTVIIQSSINYILNHWVKWTIIFMNLKRNQNAFT